MPSPTYQYARYTDWIFQFVDDKCKSKLMSNPMYTETLKGLKVALENLTIKMREYDREIKDNHTMIYGLSTEEIGDTDVEMESEFVNVPQDNASPDDSENIKNLIPRGEDSKVETEFKEFKSFPRPYIIGKVINEVETDSVQQDMYRISLSELVCQHTWNHPLGKSKTTKDFFDVYKFRKADISTWKMKPVKQVVVSKNAYNEKFVDPVKDKKNEEESMQQEDEDSQLRPICEDYEKSDGDEDQQTDHKPKNQDDDRKINEDLNDREFEENIPELIEMGDDPAKASKESDDEPMNLDEAEEEKNNDGFIGPKYLDEDPKDNPKLADEEIKVDNNASDLTDQLYDTNPIALRLSVYNFCSKKIKVEVLVKTRGEATNFHVPICSIKAEIPANKSKAIACFPKLHPYKPFGEYFFEYVTDIEPSAPEVRPDAPQNEQAQGGSGTQTDKVDPNVWQDEVDPTLDGLQDEINCEICTYFNPITSYKCEICGSVLPHRK